MIIGVPKEIKNNENRVAVTPAGVREMVARGHEVYVQTTAGNGSGFSAMNTAPPEPRCCLRLKMSMPSRK